MKNSKKLLSVLLTMIMTFSLMLGGLTTAFAAPAAPAVTNTGYINSTNQAAYAITGTGVAGATVDVTVTGGATVSGTGTVDGSGNFSVSVNVSTLAEGNISITATQTDGTGVSLASAPVSVTKDTTLPTITSITSDAATSGILKIGQTILFTLTPGTIEAGAAVAGSYNGQALTWSTVDSGATYTSTYTVTQGDTDQATPLQISGVTITDSAGNISTASAGTGIMKTIDANVPIGTTITTTPQSVNTSTITITGMAETSSTVNITGGSAPASGAATGGAYSIDVTLAANTINTLSVTATDAAGNVSNAATVAITQDSIAPVVTGVIEGGFYQTVSPAFTEGTATLTTGTGSPVVYASEATIAGDSAQVLVVTDAVGNVTTVNFTTDNTAPTAPTVGIIDGALYDDNGVTPNISSPIDATQTITLDGAAYTSGAITTDGAHELVITNTDAAGNASSITVNFTVDAVVPVITLVGSSTVTVAQGSTYTDAGATASDNINVDITASIVPSGTVDTTTVGSYTLMYNVSDAAGNPATAVTRTVVVAPAAPAVTADDVNNVIVGADDTMEYSTDAGTTWIAYDTTTPPTFPGVVTVDVRVAADIFTGAPAGAITSLTFTAVGDITGNNILLVGAYAFDLNDPAATSGYNLNNFLLAAQTAYSTDGVNFHIYAKIGTKWYDIVSDSTMADPILDLSTINGNGGLFNYMNMNMQ